MDSVFFQRSGIRAVASSALLVLLAMLIGCPHDLVTPPPIQDLGAGADRIVTPRETGVRQEAGPVWPDRGGAVDTRAPDGPKDCACEPSTSRRCGPCDLGTEVCRADCTGYRNCEIPPEVCDPSSPARECGNCGEQTCGLACSWRPCEGDGECKKGDKRDCPNNCGEQICSDTCHWGDCSRNDEYLEASGKLCYSTNHCGIGIGRCVDCWLKCDADGETYEDAWCAGANCQVCSSLGDPCPP